MLVHALVFHEFIQFTFEVIKAMFTLYQADMKSCLVSCVCISGNETELKQGVHTL